MPFSSRRDLRLASSSIRAAGLGLMLAAGILLPHGYLSGQAPAGGQGREQDPARARPTMIVDEAAGTISFSMDQSRQMGLIEFLEWGQAVTGKRFTFNAEQLRRATGGDDGVGFIGTFRLERKRFSEDIFSFFKTMLFIKGLAVVPRGEGEQQVFEIIAAADPRSQGERGEGIRGDRPQMVVDEAKDTIAISMGPGKGMELIEFVKWAQELTGKRFTFNAEELRRTSHRDATVSFVGTFRFGRQRFVEDFFSFFQTMLHVKGFAVVPRGEGDLEVFEIEKITADEKPSERGEGAPPRMAVDQANSTISFSMGQQQQMELLEFVEWAQAVTGKRFTFSRKELQGKATGDNTVSFLGTIRMKRDHFAEDFFAFFRTMLFLEGFAVVPLGEGDLEMFQIVRMAGTHIR